MNSIFLFLTLTMLPFGLFAFENKDLSKSKGTAQAAIVSLMPTPTQTDVSRYTEIEAVFSLPLDPSSVKAHNIKLTFLSSKRKKHVHGTVSYNEMDQKVLYTPDEPLEPGMYEVEIKSLKPMKANKTKKKTIKEIKYRFIVVEELLKSITVIPNPVDVPGGTIVKMQAIGHYDNGTDKDLTSQVIWSVENNATALIAANGVLTTLKEGSTFLKGSMGNVEGNASVTVYRIINGHRLPPKPDPHINDSTLLGIDSNDNGVRDDVEREIYNKVKKPVQQALLMQDARFFQLTLLKPVSEAKEIQKYSTRSIDCYIYLRRHDEQIHSDEWRNIRIEIKNLTFNSADRVKKYLDYNIALAGGIYGSSPSEWNEDACDFNVTELLAE